MALILKNIFEFYNNMFTIWRDPRSDSYFLLGGSPLPIVSILTAYVMLCKYGPVIMETRKAFNPQSFMNVYNFLQVCGNTVFAIWATNMVTREISFSVFCQPIDYSDTKGGNYELRGSYYYFCFKIFDLLDTVFIVLKKNNKQLSFLHRYHHFFVLLGSYTFAKWAPGGLAAPLGIINTFVHCFMYLYYFLTAFKPELKKSIWWKRYITQLQILQFAILFLIYSRALLDKSCTYPKNLVLLLLTQVTFMLVMFSDFYIKVYIKDKRKK